MIDKAAITNSPDTIPVDEDCYDSVLQLLIEITTVKNKQPMDNPSGLISFILLVVKTNSIVIDNSHFSWVTEFI